jgi:hypothetical protein
MKNESWIRIESYQRPFPTLLNHLQPLCHGAVHNWEYRAPIRPIAGFLRHLTVNDPTKSFW